MERANTVVALTGAGISAESGIPTFRDPGGIWEKFKPQELANVQAFLRNPVLVQGWYQHRRAVAEDTGPNAGHLALAEMEKLMPEFTLITQNVDNLHFRAGSKNLLELHGNISRSYCIDCRKPATEADLEPLREGQPATCMLCGGLFRPDVVWFGELLHQDTILAAQQASREADVFLSIGTSALVYPAAELPLIARESGAYVVEINIQPSALSDQMDEVLLGKAGTILPDLIQKIKPHP